MRRLLLFLALALLVCAPAGAAEPGLPKGLAWVRELAEDSTVPPVVTGDVVLIRIPGRLLAFHTADGAEAWSAESTDAAELRAGMGVVLDGGVARDAANGRLLWQGTPQPGSVALDGSRAWWLEKDVLVSRDLRTGEVRFRRQLPGIREFRLQGGYALFVDAEGAGAWNLHSDRLAWRHPGASAALPTSGGALVLGRDGRLQKVLPNEHVAWHVEGPVAEVLPLEQGLAAIRTARYRLQVLDADGRALWSRDDFYDLERLADLGKGRLLLSNYDGTAFLDARTGRTLGTVRDGQLWPAGRLGEVVTGVGRSGTIYRLDARTGRLLPGFRGQLPPGWGGGSAATGSGKVFLARGGSLVAVGPGPGLRHLASAPELVLTVPSPQLPGSAGVTVHGRFTRLVALQVWRMPGETPKGPPVASRTVSLPAGHESQELSVRLPLPGPGTYLVTARAGDLAQQAVLTATGLGLTAKLSPERLLVQAVDTRTGRPAAGVDIALFRQGKRLGRTRTDATGAALLPAPGGERAELVVMAAWKGQRIRFPFWPEHGDWSHSVFLETDRPIYRPGHKVHFRGVAMRDRDGELQVAPGEKVAVEVRDATDNRLLAQEVTTDEAGTFSGDLALAAEPPLGRYSLSATVAGSSRSFRLPFDVQEYRKPPFQVEVRPEQPLVVGGRPLTFLVAATRWFGGPVPGATLRWRLERQRLYGGPTEPGEEEEAWRGYREFVSEGTGVLDELGRTTLRLEVPPPTEDDYSYLLSVDVAGSEGREVPGSATVLVSRGEFSLRVSPRSWLAKPGQPLALDVSTRDLLGRGHAAQVQLAFLEERWAGGDWNLVRRGTATLRTGADGRGAASWTPPTSGYYRVEATAKDRAGRALTDHTWVWVPGAGSLAYDWPSLKLVPERRTAKPGERIRVLVLADRPGPLLWTVEGARLFDHRVVDLRGPATVVEVPIRAEHAPEIHLSATLMRQDEPASAETRIRVPDTAHEVKVDVVPDREDYRPGGTARLDVRTSRGGKPVQAHLSLALVDEAIFALREDQAGSIHRFFYGSRENRVQTFHLMPRSAEAAGFQTVEAPGRVRSEFQDTAFWSARVLTGPDGTGRVEVPLPDDLTRWRATARAVAPPDGVGQTVSHLVTRLPLMVQVIAPRFFVAGDRSAVLAVVHNRTAAPVEAGVKMQAQGAALAPGSGRVSVPVDGSSRDAAQVEVGEGPEVVLQAEARAAGEVDAERIRVPVEPRGVRRNEYRAGVAHGALAWDLEVPAGATRGALQVRVDGSAAGVVTGALGYLVGFPYGCVEQTMSRFLPTVIASQAMEKLGLAAARRAELEPMVTAGLQKLYGYQHSDGGWGWWVSDQTHPFMTGYVVMGLARAREAGWDVSEPVLARGIEAASALMAASGDPEERAWLAWALAEAGQPPRESLTALASQDGLGVYSRALVTLALVRAGDLETARRLATRLKAEAVTDGAGAWWPARSPTPYGWTDDDVEATSLVIRALQEALGPDEPLVARGVDWLVQQRRGSAWKSTRDTAQAVLTLSRFLEARRETGAGGQTEVLWNGQSLGVVDPTRPEPRPIELEGLPPGRHRVEIRPSGGAPVASARLSWVEPLRSEGESHGVTVTRRLLKADGSPLSPLEVRAGDLVQVQLVIDAPRALEYVILEDPRAAGVEPVPEERDEDTWHRYTRREDRDERTVFFFTDLEKGQATVTYTVRAETPGTFTVLPARVELMYRPEVWGLSDPATLEIR